MKPLLQIFFLVIRKRFIVSLSFILLLTQTTLATTLTVKQDSTGDYLTIQAAVDASTDGDTVLAWPGTYYENVIIDTKNITIGSLTLTTNDNSYIQQTIIDGMDTASCVAVVYCNMHVEINGFTIQHGLAKWNTRTSGGGILILKSDVSIYNCIVKNNLAYMTGGGINIDRSNVFLSSTDVFNNHSYSTGGGMYILKGELEFDSIYKCNIYLNYAAAGTDIYHVDDSAYSRLHVIVDTFTIQAPDYYYLYDFRNQGQALSYDIEHPKIETVKQDLFVSPAGDNNNSGLSPDEALKDIYFALLKIASDSLSPDTIHVANGTYSLADSEKFPLSLKRDVSIKGEDRDLCILDADNKIYLLNGIRYADNYSIKNLTLRNGSGNYTDSFNRGTFILKYNRNALFENLLITENYGSVVSGGYVLNCSNTRFRNVDFLHNTGGNPIRIGDGIPELHYDTVFVENCVFIENLPDSSIPDEGLGGDVSTMGRMFSDYPDQITVVFTNCLFNKNRARILESGGGGAASFHASFSSQVYLINCTFTENVAEHPESVSVGITWGSNMHVFNTIMYEDEPVEIGISGSADQPCSLDIYNSLLDGGEEGIKLISSYNTVFYDEATNIDTDPLFLGKWEHPYQIADGSPCIDAGTLANLPDFIPLPDTDLAGNPRIVGDSIDMGAYEWNPTVGIDKYQYQPIKNEKPKLLQAAPNPFSWHTTISAKWDFTGYVQIEIYNNAGLRVKVLKSGRSGGKGSINAKWDGKDQNGNLLPADIYHVVMFWEGREVEGIKVVKR